MGNVLLVACGLWLVWEGIALSTWHLALCTSWNECNADSLRLTAYGGERKAPLGLSVKPLNAILPFID